MSELEPRLDLHAAFSSEVPSNGGWPAPDSLVGFVLVGLVPIR